MKSLEELKASRRRTIYVEAWATDVVLQPVPAREMMQLRDLLDDVAANAEGADMEYSIQLISRSIPELNSDEGRNFLREESAEVILALVEPAREVNNSTPKKKVN